MNSNNMDSTTFQKISEGHQQIIKNKMQSLTDNQPIQTFVKSSETQQYSFLQNKQLILKFVKITERNIYRKFIKQFIFTYIESLKHSNKVNKPQLQINWPFKELYQLKNKSEDEKMLMEFVNLCAVKIQSVFKGYIAQKRHKLALKLVKKVKVIQSLIKSWKVRNIMKCKKIKDIKQNISDINKQIQAQDISKNRSSKRLHYLYEDYNQNIQNFQKCFYRLYSTGLWVYEVEKSAKLDNKIKEKIHNKISFQSISQKIQIINTETVQKSKTNRIRRAQKAQIKQVIHQIESTQIKVANQSQVNYREKDILGDDRPIKSKGNYSLELEKIVFEEPAITHQKKEEKNQKKQKQQNKQFLTQQLVRLHKRQKYDPRKAIENAKNKATAKQIIEPLPEKNNRETITTQNMNSVNKIVQDNRSTLKTNKNIKSENDKIVAKVESIKVEKIKDKVVGNNKTKRKVQPRIQCWNKKTVTINNSNQWIRTQTDKDSNDQENIRERQKQIEQEREKERQMERQMEQERRKKAYEGLLRKQQYKRQQFVRRNNSYDQIGREEKYKRLNSNMKKIIERLTDNKKKEVYRPVEDLIEAYNSQYGTRYQNLMPKIGLLSYGRKTEMGKGIAVIRQDNASVTKSLTLSPNLFWQYASKMQKGLRQFITN